MIDVCLGTIGRHACFRKSMKYLNAQRNAGELFLYIMDGNNDDGIQTHIAENQWNFKGIKVYKESEVLDEKSRARWPVIYNYLIRKGSSPFVTFWSDDIYPEPDCFKIGLKAFKGSRIGGVAFAWREDKSSRYVIYGTEMHRQVMINFGLIRRSVLKKVGYIDEGYSFYNADQDLSLKIWYSGFKIVREKRAKLTHSSHKKAKNKNRTGKSNQKDINRLMNKWSYDKVGRRKVKL